MSFTSLLGRQDARVPPYFITQTFSPKLKSASSPESKEARNVSAELRDSWAAMEAEATRQNRRAKVFMAANQRMPDVCLS